MSRPTVFIDGQQGSTGLRIHALLTARADLELVQIDPERRKDQGARREMLRAADFAVLCLPDAAAGEAVALVGDADTRLIDASTARRLDPDWIYGLPEMTPEQRGRIAGSARVANPGCYPQSYILAVRPLIEAGMLAPDTPFTVNAVSGYSGGGRQMVEAYRSAAPTPEGDAGLPLCLYGLDGKHKHLPEMAAYAGADRPPLFVPSVDHSFCGMLVSIPLHADVLGRHGAADIHAAWTERYSAEPLLNVYSPAESRTALRDGKFLDLTARAGSNCLDLLVYEAEGGGAVLVGRLDNLGKGAAGNAVQCLNIMLGVDETTGLEPAAVSGVARAAS